MKKLIVSGISFAIPTLLMVFISLEASAQTGTLSGQISDDQTGEPLQGAQVDLDAAGMIVLTDHNGRFILNNVPAGSHTAMVHFPGYVSGEMNFSIDSAENAVQDHELVGEFGGDDQVFTTDRQRSQAMALNRQQDSWKVKSMVTSDQMDRFTDISVSSSLARIPGVQKSGTGEINIRGVGQGMNYVTIDGTRMGNTGLGDRSFDLNNLTTDMVRELEVIKVLTPDMDADGLAGAVNIVTRRPAGGDRVLNARVGGMADTDFVTRTGPGSRASLEYAESPRDDFSIALNLDHNWENTGWQSLGIDYGTRDFGPGPVDVVQRISPGMHLDERNRLGSMLKMSFQPTESTSYYIQGMFHNNIRGLDHHEYSWRAEGDWENASTPAEGEGMYHYNLYRQESLVRNYTVRAGGRYVLPVLSVDYSLGWGSGEVNQTQFVFPFESDLDYTLDTGDRSRPVAVVDGDLPGSLDTRLQQMTRIIDTHTDNNYSGRLDVEIPFAMGAVKVGSSALVSNKLGGYSNARFQNLRSLNISNFDQRSRGTADVLDHYHFPWLLDSHEALKFFENSLPAFRKFEEADRERSDIWNYETAENIYAGYGMATLDFGSFSLLGGVRLEQTDARYDGRRVLFNDNGRYVASLDTSQSVDYMNLFPHAQVAFSPSDLSKVRLAYSRSMARQNYNLLAPFELTNAQDTTLFRGNPQLDPMLSDNFDLIFDHYFMDIGHFGLNLFYKELTGYIYEREQMLEVREGDVHGAFDRIIDEDTPVLSVYDRQFHNSDETASVYGVEVSWQQNLGFLPGFLGNMSTYASYTWSHSVFESDERDDEVALPAQSPHSVNAALQYSQGRFSAQASYHWTAASVQQLRRSTSIAPSIDPSQPVYLDRYQDGWTDVSVSLRYRVTNSLRIWVDAFNLLNEERIQYDHTRDLYPRVTELRSGRGLRAGIRYDL